MRPRTEFRLLGPLEVLVGGRPARLSEGKQRALLALLILRAGEAVPVDALIDALWHERPPASAGNSVQIYVSRLRKELGEERLLTRGRAYMLALDDEDEVDARAFERLVDEGRRLRAAGKPAAAADTFERALELWRGSPLEEFRYDDFAQQAITRLEEQRLFALEERNEAELALGRAEALVPDLEALVSRHPLRERLRGQLMLALYRSGRQAEALEVFQDARRMLRDELGLEPSAELRALELSILNQDPALDAARARPQPEAARRGWLLALAGSGALLLAVIAAAVLVATRGGGEAGLIALPANAIGAIDPQTNRIVAQVPVGARPGPIVAGGGALWVANLDDRTVSRVDPATKTVVRTVAVGQAPTGLAFQGGRVWVASSTTLSAIDPRYDRTTPTLPIEAQHSQEPGGNHLATAGFGSVWVSDRRGLVTRFDDAGQRRSAEVVAGVGASGIAAGEGAVWVANTGDGTVARIDPTNVVTATVPVGHGPEGVAVGAGAVWVTLAFDGLLVRIDPATNSVRATIPVGRRPEAVVATADAVWVADSVGGKLYRVDPAKNRVAGTIEVGNSPSGLALVGGSLWVTVAPLPAVRTLPRGGTLKVEVAEDPGPLDPAVPNPGAWPFEYATCAKLLNYPDRSAPEGGQLRPEVTQAFPTRSHDGSTYTFTIRPGFRFSPPSNEPVTARTFKESLERAASPRMRSYVGSYLADVVGARAFLAGRAKSISGIVARGDKLAFHLTQASGSFPARLAMPYFCAVPVGTPPDRDGIPELASAGPYFVSDYVPGHRLVLKRNPNYHGERPRRPAFIHIAIGVDPRHETADVEVGRADYAAGGVAAGARARLKSKYARGNRRYFENPVTQISYLALNTSRPLFADAKLRRAVSYLLDRRALASLHRRFFQVSTLTGGPPTAEYLPPQLRLSRAALYPARPDLARARKLAGGRRGTAILYTCDQAPCPQQAAIVKRDLARIGIEVIVQQFPAAVKFERASRRNAPYDILVVSWFPDFFDPAQILTVLDPAVPAPEGNYSRFDDPRFAARLRAAESLTGPRRYRAYDALAHDLARVAPIVVFANDASDDFFSARVGCQTFNPVYGIDLAALCIRPHRG